MVYPIPTVHCPGTVSYTHLSAIYHERVYRKFYCRHTQLSTWYVFISNYKIISGNSKYFIYQTIVIQ